MFLRCTQKFLTELRLRKSDTAEAPADLHPLDEWYAHVFFLYPRRKCAMFMHAQTQFCFVVFDKNRAQLNDLKGLFHRGLGKALFDEQYPAPVIKLFNERLENIQIGRAQDRRVLGYMNQWVQDLKWYGNVPLDRRGTDEMIAGLDLRRTPMVSGKDGRYAAEKMRDVLLSCRELKGVDIPGVDLRPEELEKFFQGLHAGRQEGEG